MRRVVRSSLYAGTITDSRGLEGAVSLNSMKDEKDEEVMAGMTFTVPRRSQSAKEFAPYRYVLSQRPVHLPLKSQSKLRRTIIGQQ
jgi:hypothetical protein